MDRKQAISWVTMYVTAAIISWMVFYVLAVLMPSVLEDDMGKFYEMFGSRFTYLAGAFTLAGALLLFAGTVLYEHSASKGLLSHWWLVNIVICLMSVGYVFQTLIEFSLYVKV